MTIIKKMVGVNNVLTFFIILQTILFVCMLLHDWISIPPLNDIDALKKSDTTFYRVVGSLINGGLVLYPLILTIIYSSGSFPQWAAWRIFLVYLLLTFGAICSWWIPYFCGSKEWHKEAFKKFENTHHFLPARNDNVIPNTLHVILHLQICLCLIISTLVLKCYTIL